MSDSDDLRIVIDEDDTAADAPRRTQAVDDTNQDLERIRAETARANAETIRLRAETAANRIGTALNMVQIEAASARDAFKQSYEIGDSAGLVEAQARMAEIEARRAHLQAQEQTIRSTPVPPSDPVEAFCANRSEPTANWVKAHPDWVRDPRKQAKLTSAHYDAIAEGHAPDTPGYFEKIERAIGLKGDGNKRSTQPEPQKYDPNDYNTHVSRGGKEVYLTAGEAKAAVDGSLVWNFGPKKGQPLGIQEVSRRKAQMIAEGRYSQLG